MSTTPTTISADPLAAALNHERDTGYIKWKTRENTRTSEKYERVGDGKYLRPVKRARPTGSYSLTATLVKSERVNGKPRQKTIAHLATLQVWTNHERSTRGCGPGFSGPTIPIAAGGKAFANRVRHFWEDVEAKLDRLDGINRDAILAKVSRVVPMLDPALRARLLQESARIYESCTGKKWSSGGKSDSVSPSTPLHEDDDCSGGKAEPLDAFVPTTAGVGGAA